MEDPNNEAEQTAGEDNSTSETNKDSAQVNYEQEFKEQLEKFERSEQAREGYARRKGLNADDEDENADEIGKKVEEAIQKQLPKLQSSLAADSVEQVLNEIAPTEAERKLIRFHFENSVSPNGTIRERLENAKLIANKKTIFKTQKEMAIALSNRAGLSPSGTGPSTEGNEVKDTYFSKEQLDALKAKGWDEKKIERLKANLRKQRSF